MCHSLMTILLITLLISTKSWFSFVLMINLKRSSSPTFYALILNCFECKIMIKCKIIIYQSKKIKKLKNYGW